MENMSIFLFLGYVISGIKLVWAFVVPVIIYLICRKISAATPKWITYCLVIVAITNLQNAIPVFLSRILSVTHYSFVMLISNTLNDAGAIIFLAAVYGMASMMKKMHDKKGTF
jgi:hypothetical protein